MGRDGWSTWADPAHIRRYGRPESASQLAHMCRYGRVLGCTQLSSVVDCRRTVPSRMEVSDGEP